MKLRYKWILPFIALGFVACDSDDDGDMTEPVNEVELSTGTADVSTYVSVGSTITAGYADNALFIASQMNSFPNILSERFAQGGGGDFVQPLMNDNIGGLLFAGQPIPGIGPRLIFDGSSPVPLPATPTTEVTQTLSGPFNNYGVPGAKVYHLLAEGYGNPAGVPVGLANPYFVRFASSPATSVLADAMAQNPTFFTLWVGNNDVLGYAATGGIGVNQEGNFDPSTYGMNDITDPQVFAQAYAAVAGQLAGTGAQGIVATIPDLTSLPFFTTVPNNALALDAAQAAQLTGVFQAVSGIFIQGLIAQGVDPAQAQALGAQYAITFSEGPNRWLIDVPATQTNPLGFRQMTEEELVVLTIDQSRLVNEGYGSIALTPDVLQVLGKLQQGVQITAEEGQLVLAAVNGLDDYDVLDTDEIAEVSAAKDSFNQTIKTTASGLGLAVFDSEVYLDQLASTGVSFGDFNMTADLITGGAFSLDGIHLTARGNAWVASEMLRIMDASFGSNFEEAGLLPQAGDYPVIYSASLP